MRHTRPSTLFWRPPEASWIVPNTQGYSSAWAYLTIAYPEKKLLHLLTLGIDVFSLNGRCIYSREGVDFIGDICCRSTIAALAGSQCNY